MKKFILGTCCFLLICVLTSIFVIARSQKTVETEPRQENTKSLTYVVKDFNGYIAVFEKGKESPFKITEINISQLSPTDQQILQHGIEAETSYELTQILEDYCS